ncbi:MAG: hypothetical protein MUD04_11090 [Cyanobium sp. Prado107]|nr:hypothetical protein [Cyanobium sp. Prado107]
MERAGSKPWRSPHWAAPLRLLLTVAMLLVLLVPSGCSRTNQVSGSQGAGPRDAARQTGPLQEVAPPVAVQQLAAALSARHPRVSVTAPRDGSLLPPGGWNLEINGSDWPLADAGELGLGAHIVVQMDEDPPLRLTAAEPAPEGFRLSVPMAELTPGSHRITVYAARPWGEVVKSPGASAQIRVHRAAVNPLGLPAAGSAQLIAASPAELSTAEPVLVDWLLKDAPLQGLREGDQRWRLRMTVNGDSVLLDRNAPLWLKGWRSGSNSVLLELVDERGEPINPPFNSLVREVTLGGTARRPRWLGGALSEAELAALLGEIQIPLPSEAPSSTPADATSDTQGEAQLEAPVGTPGHLDQADDGTDEPEDGGETPHDQDAPPAEAAASEPQRSAAEPEPPEDGLGAILPDATDDTSEPRENQA